MIQSYFRKRFQWGVCFGVNGAGKRLRHKKRGLSKMKAQAMAVNYRDPDGDCLAGGRGWWGPFLSDRCWDGCAVQVITDVGGRSSDWGNSHGLT